MASAPLQYKVRSALTELTLARIRELTREPEAVFWVFVFPIVLAAILSLAFRSRPPDPLPVGVVNGPQAAARMSALSDETGLRPRLLASEEAAQALARGHVVLVVYSEGTPDYTYDPTQPDSRTAFLLVDAALQRAAGRIDAFAPKRVEITKAGARYVDFLVPGLLGMNLMGTGMWGIGFSLVVARNGNLLKRLIAAPARRSHVLAAQLISRLLFLVPEAGALLIFAHFALGVPLRGSLLLLVAVSLLGALAFSGLGLLTAARPRTIEGVSGVMNLVMVPMWIFSGIFFSTERFPAAMQPFIQALPLTALNNALRGVMLEGAGLSSMLPQLALLAAWGAISFLVAPRSSGGNERLSSSSMTRPRVVRESRHAIGQNTAARTR
jgi:ABC-type multidrug transport system permease subunit